MPDFSPEFPFDETSTRQASELTNALRERHSKEVAERPAQLLEVGPQLEAVRKTRGRLTEPLDKISGDVPMEDILADVQDFGVLAAYSRMTDGLLSALRTGKDQSIIPLLPQVGLLEQYQRVGWPFVPPTFDWFRSKFFGSFGESAIIEVPWQKAQESFFTGLKSFLAARIGGFRWSRTTRSNQQRRLGGIGGTIFGGGGTSGGGGGTGSSHGTSSAQMWEVHTAGSGLSLAYHGTHAARIPVALPGGFTTPVNVYLPMGTLYLGANAGSGGTFRFDYTVQLTVPSTHPHPVHTTKVF